MRTADQVSIGVVIRTKDRPIFVPRALKTVIAQTHLNWQIVLVNDGGDAALLERAIATQRARPQMQGKLTLLNLSPGVGRSAAFNEGVKALSTELVACLDDDDSWSPEFMAALAAFYIETSTTVDDLGGVAAQVTALQEEICDSATGQEIRVTGEEALPPAFQRGEFFLNPLAYACYRQDIYPVQWVLRRDAVLAAGGFPEQFDVMEDRAFMNRFLARYRLAILDRKLAFHHRRAQRAEDQGRDVLLNTLDNPSYDWRLFADLARPGIDLAQSAEAAAVVRSISADLLSELNYETSAIWQKVDGDITALSARLERDKSELMRNMSALRQDLRKLTARLGQGSVTQPGDMRVAPDTSALPDIAAPAMAGAEIPLARRAYDLWRMVPAQGIAQYLQPGQRFAGQLGFSTKGAQTGLLVHACPLHSRLDVQIPLTEDWAALELSLAGMAPAGSALRVHLTLSSSEGYLFETALMTKTPDAENSFAAGAFEIHSCSGHMCHVIREIDAALLRAAISPKLSIILPRQARNFRFICHDLIVERV